MGQGQLAVRRRLGGAHGPLAAVRSVRLSRAETVILAALALWSLVPFVLLLGGHGVFNGSDGLQVQDHMQYLSFIRESGEHGLISNRFDVAPDPRLFLHPMEALSGLAWRLGASLQLAFLIWKPVAVLVLFAGFAAYVRRTLAPDRAAMGVALLLALFYLTPATPLAEWLHGGPFLRFGTLVVGFESYAATYTWGGFPGAVAVGLMPVVFLGAERALDPARRKPGRGAAWYGGWAGAAGALVSWLHPWQGITLLLVMGGLAAWGRFDRRYLALLLPAALTALPLLYVWVLSHTDSSWKTLSQPNDFRHVGWWLVLGLLPAVLALPAFARLRDLDLQERVLRLWPVAALVMYFALQRSWFYHAFGGLSLPLAILAVQGLRPLRLPRLAVAAAVCLFTIPGLVFTILRFDDERSTHFFRPDEARALAWLDDARRPGPVLAAPKPLGQAVPGFAGRNTFVGHYYWTPDYFGRSFRTEALFRGKLTPAGTRDLLRSSRAAFVLADCGRRRDLSASLRPALLRVRHFGCATVYELRPRA